MNPVVEHEILEASRLSEMKDNVLAGILDFISFRERQKCRLVCKKVKEVVDTGPLGAKSLFIFFQEKRNTQIALPYFWRVGPDIKDVDSSVVIEIECQSSSWSPDMLERVLSEIRCLPKIRPEGLYLSDHADVRLEPPILSRLLQILADEGADRTVKEMNLALKDSPTLTEELKAAFSKFAKIKKVELLARNTEHFLSVVAGWKKLTSLSLYLCLNNKLISESEAVRSLSGHESLCELVIRREHFWGGCATNLMNSLSVLKNIKKMQLDCDCFGTAEQIEVESEAESQGYVEDGFIKRRFTAFANMIHGMKKLECLDMLNSPSEIFWKFLNRPKNIVSSSIQELTIRLDSPIPSSNDSDSAKERQFQSDLQAMMDTLPTFAPSLKTLDLSCTYIRNSSHADILLRGLRNQQKLEKVNLGYQDSGDLMNLIEQGVGPKVTVNWKRRSSWGTPSFSNPAGLLWQRSDYMNSPRYVTWWSS